MALWQQKVDSHIMLAMLAYMIWPTSHDIEFDSVGERNKKGSKTEMCGENLSLAKELKVVNEPNTTYPVGGRQCTDYIKVKNQFLKIHM
jgi:hypothetical protein